MVVLKKLSIIAVILATFNFSINLAFTEEYTQDYTDKNKEYTHDNALARKYAPAILGVYSGILTKDLLDHNYKYFGGLEGLKEEISFLKQYNPIHARTLQIRCLKYVGMIGSAVILPIILMSPLKKYISLLCKEKPLETLDESIEPHTDDKFPEYV